MNSCIFSSQNTIAFVQYQNFTYQLFLFLLLSVTYLAITKYCYPSGILIYKVNTLKQYYRAHCYGFIVIPHFVFSS